MHKHVKIRTFFSKALSFWLPSPWRKEFRDFIFWASFHDFLKFKKQRFVIVSLGSNCLVRVLTTAAKLKPRKFYGEKSCPFDLCSNPDFNNVAFLIENDFHDFFDLLPRDESTFPHDCKLSNKQFKNRYLKRFQNFRNILKADNKIYFIYSDYVNLPDRDDVLRLYRVLKDKRQGKPFDFILLTNEYIDGLDGIIQLPDDFRITDNNWVVYFINKYGKFDNYYTRYCERMGKRLSDTIMEREGSQPKFPPERL